MSDIEDFDKGIDLHAKPEKPARLRTSLILGIGILLACIMIVTFIFAFSRPPVMQGTGTYETVATDARSTSNEALSMLPSDYDQMPPEEILQPIEPVLLPELPPAPIQSTVVYQPQPTVDNTEDEIWAAGMFFDGNKNRGATQAQIPQQFNAGTNVGNLLGGGVSEQAGNYAQDLPVEDQQNLQSQKLGFLNQARNDEFILNDRLHSPVSPYEIKGGTLISGALITSINSDLPGDIIAQVTEHVYDTVTGQYLLIPQGSKLYGRYDSVVSYGQERVLVAWTRLIMPNGKSIALDGMIAADPSGASGLYDQVDNHFGRLAGAVLLSTAISLGGNLSNDDDGDSVGADVGDTVAQEASRVGQRYVNKSINIQPTLKIRGGAEVRVFVNKDMILEPYQAL